jgi:hypothetical protein
MGSEHNREDGEPGTEPEMPVQVTELLAAPSTWATPPPGVLEGVLSRIRAERAAEGCARRVELAGTELAADAAGVATVRTVDGGVAVSLSVRELPAAEPGTQYEVWLSRADGPAVRAGAFDLRDGTVPVELSAETDAAGSAEWDTVTVVVQRVRGRRRPHAPIVLHGTVPPPDDEQQS